MDNKLSELSKPFAWTDSDAVDILNAGKWAPVFPEKYQDSFPLYSQEYVSTLLAELEAKDKRIAELESGNELLTNQRDLWYGKVRDLEAKLATPVRLPTTSGRLGVAYARVIPEVTEAIRAAGFTVEGDE